MSAFKISAKITNTKSLKSKFKVLEKELMDRQVRAVQESTLLIHNIAVSSIQDNSKGTPQVRYRPKRTVLVSKPGSPPNTDRGVAAQSIKFDFKNGGLLGRVGTNLKYLAALEFGTKNTKARPWLSTAIKVAKKDIIKLFKKSLSVSIDKVKK